MRFEKVRALETSRAQRREEFFELMGRIPDGLTSREREIAVAIFNAFDERFLELELQIAAKADPDYDEPGR